MTKEAMAALMRPRSFILSRILWPQDRLMLAAASNDNYHHFVGTYYVISWSLTTIYVTAYCMYNRIKRRREEGMSILEILCREAALLCFIGIIAELWSLLWWIACTINFYAIPCVFYHSWAPLDTIIGSSMRLCLEAIFLFTLVLGPAISPQELGIIEPVRRDDNLEGNWENELQALLITRFSLVFMPRKILRWF